MARKVAQKVSIVRYLRICFGTLEAMRSCGIYL